MKLSALQWLKQLDGFCGVTSDRRIRKISQGKTLVKVLKRKLDLRCIGEQLPLAG